MKTPSRGAKPVTSFGSAAETTTATSALASRWSSFSFSIQPSLQFFVCLDSHPRVAFLPSEAKRAEIQGSSLPPIATDLRRAPPPPATRAGSPPTGGCHQDRRGCLHRAQLGAEQGRPQSPAPSRH